jgi:hypothetical protein
VIGTEAFQLHGGPVLDRDGHIWTCTLKPA